MLLLLYCGCCCILTVFPSAHTQPGLCGQRHKPYTLDTLVPGNSPLTCPHLSGTHSPGPLLAQIFQRFPLISSLFSTMPLHFIHFSLYLPSSSSFSPFFPLPFCPFPPFINLFPIFVIFYLSPILFSDYFFRFTSLIIPT